MTTARESTVRQHIIDWLDDNYHFGETEAMIGGDEGKSFLHHGVLDSLGFVRLLLHIEKTFGVRIDRKDLSPANFDGLRKIVAYVSALPDYHDPP